jgi:hypothetical protein
MEQVWLLYRNWKDEDDEDIYGTDVVAIFNHRPTLIDLKLVVPVDDRDEMDYLCRKPKYPGEDVDGERTHHYFIRSQKVYCKEWYNPTQL